MRNTILLATLLLAAPLVRAQSTGADEELKYAHSLSSAFNGAAERIGPSVAYITTRTERFVQRRDFFGRRLRPQRLLESGLGSGVVISADGTILTNNHVVEDADELLVRLSDGREFPARLVGTDVERDLAVIQIDQTGLVPAEWGDSDALQIGEWVLAAGSPFGFSNTVTAGIVSARGPSTGPIHDELSKYEDYIQTDAAINPGNSGGPLINLDGKVVGINTAIFSRSGGSVGLGFAIPANLAREVAGEIITNAPPPRGWLGVEMQELDASLADTFGVKPGSGVLVAAVVPGGPADAGGLEAGDIVTAFNGAEVRSNRDFVSAIHDAAPESVARIDLLREGRTRTIEVELGDLERYLEERYGAIGIDAETVTPAAARELGYRQLEGVLVTNVESNGVADRCGLLPDDVIVGIDDRPVTNIGELDAALREIDLDTGVRVRIMRGGRRGYIVLRR